MRKGAVEETQWLDEMLYEFVLKFALPDTEADPAVYEDALFEAGCDDAMLGLGINGRIGLDFAREASSSDEAMSSAIEQVKRAIPEAKLVEATPDLVGLTDVADIIGCSRQNMRKVFVSKISQRNLPTPVHSGRVDLWHLYDVLNYLKSKERYAIQDSLLETSMSCMLLNTAKQMRETSKVADEKVLDRFQHLLA